MKTLTMHNHNKSNANNQQTITISSQNHKNPSPMNYKTTTILWHNHYKDITTQLETITTPLLNYYIINTKPLHHIAKQLKQLQSQNKIIKSKYKTIPKRSQTK